MPGSPLSSVVYWHKGEKIQNFGDYLSEYLTSRLFFEYRPDVSGVHIIGSVVDDMFVPRTVDPERPVLFWGCGVRQAGGLSPERMKSAHVLSVRGPLSAAELGLGDRVPEGDPAFVLPALYKPRKLDWLAGKSICVPHFHDTRSDQVILAASGCDFVVRPNIEDNEKALTDVIDAIFSADFVLGSAMHACVVAAAYRRPFAFWRSDRIDLPFKWRDLSASLNIPCEFVSNISEGTEYYETKIAPFIQIPNLIPCLLRSPLLVRASGMVEVLRWYQEEGNLFAGHQGAFANVQALIFFAKTQQDIFNAILEEVADNRRQAESARQEMGEYDILRAEFSKMLALQAAADEERADVARELITARERAERSAQTQRDLYVALAEIGARNARLERELSAAVAKIGRLEQDVGRIRELAAGMGRVQADEAIHRQRSFFGRLLFRRNGRPARALRRILFHANGKPRGIFRSWIIGATGQPRKSLRQWMTSEEYLALPQAYRGRGAEPAVSNAPPSKAKASISPKRIGVGVPVSGDKKRILIIDSVYPTPNRDSGSVDAVNFAKMFLNMNFCVYFSSTANFASNKLSAIEKEAKEQLEELGVVVLDDNHAENINEIIRSDGRLFDLFFISRVNSGGVFFEDIRKHCQSAKILFNMVDVHFMREIREGYLEGSRLKINESFFVREREMYLVRLADATIVVSEQEAKLLAEEVPGASVYEVPLIRDVPGRKAEFSSRHHMGFIGGYRHLPNLDAVKYFLDAIWPLVRQELPDVQFHLMGADMPDELRERVDPGLVIVGHVADLREAFERLRLTVAPLRYGAGAKGKVVSSLSHGVPCICSPMAAEGMGLEEAGGALVAESAEDFAKLIVRAYTDETLWLRLSDEGLRLMHERHDFDAGTRRMKAILQDMGLSASAPAGVH